MNTGWWAWGNPYKLPENDSGVRAWLKLSFVAFDAQKLNA
jgi:hypothetical protein